MNMLIAVIFFLLFYTFISWRRLDWAVMFLLVSLPVYLIRFNVFGIPTTLLEAMILIAFAVWVIKTRTCLVCNVVNNLKGKRTTIRYPFDVEIILFLVIALVSAGVAGFSSVALGIWKAYFFEPVLVFILVMNVFNNPRIYKSSTNIQITNTNGLEKVLWPLAISALIVSLIAIFQKITGLFAVEAFWPRVTGPFPYPNALGLFLGPLVIIMIGWIMHILSFRVPPAGGTRNPLNCATIKGLLTLAAAQVRNDKIKLSFIFTSVVLSLLAIYSARSEGAIAGILAALFVFGIFAGGKWRWAALGITLAVGIGVLTYAPLRTYAIEKITLRDLSGEIRKQQWRETWAMMTASPARFIFGTGLSGYQAAIKPYHQAGIFFNKDREPWEQFHRKTVFNEEYRRTHWQPVEIYMYPHNILLNFWTELGIAGALLFIWTISKFLVLIISNFKFLISKKITNYKLQITNYSSDSYKYINLALLGTMVVIIVHGIVDVPYFKNDLSVMFWVMLVTVGLMNLEVKSKKLET